MTASAEQTRIVEFPADGWRRAAAASRRGARRTINEDRWLVAPAAEGRPLLLAVADGVGGEEAGERASADALAAMERSWRTWRPGGAPHDHEVRQALTTAAVAADAAVRRLAAGDTRLARAATTLTAAAVTESHAYVVHAGDSRAYLMGPSGVRQLTVDDSWIENEVAAGRLAAAQAASHPMRNVITRFLGMPGGCECSAQSVVVGPQDWLFLCTDGVSNVVDQEGLDLARRDASRRQNGLPGGHGSSEPPAGPATLVKTLIGLVEQANGSDDATLVLAGPAEPIVADRFGLREARTPRRPFMRGRLVAGGAAAIAGLGVAAWLGPRALSALTAPLRASPQPASLSYFDRWAAGDYPTLYHTLSKATRHTIAQQEFVQLHQNLAAEMTLVKAGFRLLSDPTPWRLSTQRAMPFEAIYQTARFGELRRQSELPLIWEENHWRIQWSPSVVLPELSAGRTLRALAETAQRGSLLDVKGRPLAVATPSGPQAPSGRTYPQGQVAGPLLGYVAEIDAEELKALAVKGYVPGDRLGKAGLEAAAEPILAGQRGGRLTVAAASGELASTLAAVPARAGETVITTLDLDLQREAEAALGNRAGSIVVVDPASGAIRALATWPRYDPNAFVSGEGVAAILTDPRRPLVNRPAQGLYPPGSIFKPIAMAAALERGAFQAPSEFTCTGRWTGLPGVSQACWLATGHGKLDLVSGLTQSCDTVFYEVGKRLDEIDAQLLPSFTAQCGLGAPTGALSGQEPAGAVPSPQWKQQTLREPWARGDAVNMAIGQGSLLVTPLQMAAVYTSIAAGQPRALHVLERAVMPGGNVERSLPAPAAPPFPWSASTFQAVRAGLKGVVGAPTGTAAFVFQGSPLEQIAAGKTGTAEAGAGREPHAWFACFAPFDAPRAVVLVMLEHAGEGSRVAAPVARRLLEFALR